MKFRVRLGTEYLDQRLALTPKGGVVDIEDSTWCEESEDCIVERFIGLQDKDGNDIYEGDFLKVCGGVTTKIYEAKWKIYGFDLENIKSPGEYFTEYFQEDLTHYDFKIIGSVMTSLRESWSCPFS